MTANAANIYNVRADATFELKSFFSAVSSMVDDTDPSDPEKFAEQFSGEVFRFNGKKIRLLLLLRKFYVMEEVERCGFIFHWDISISAIV